ncbi:MAG: type IX secretion system membrane protein PorP/SprF [Bacteroidales bacterium]|nr:type IX secretion system membrane protein PorP/SprF [Bacteroidales bacterium]
MMTRFTHILTLLILLGFFLKSQGQSQPDPHFSQFYANQLYLNPALAGSNVCPRLSMSYRNQWPSLPNNFVSYSAAFDMYIPKISGGVGIYFLGDNAGDLINTNIISAMYSYRLQIGNWTHINFGLEASYIQTTLKWNNLIFGDMIDPNQGVVNPTSEVPPDNNSIAYPDFDAGIAFSYKGNIYGGVAVHHLTEPNNAFYDASTSKLYMKVTVHGGAFIDLTGSSIRDDNYGSFSISPNFLYMQQDNFHQLNVGLYVNYRPFIVGAWFRHNFENVDAIVPMIGLDWKGLKVGYSYDITLSNLKGTTGGAHEVSLGWQFNCMDQKRRRIKAINCPRF